MSDDYLWNGSGPVDPDVERLERLLAPLRSSPPVPQVAPRRRIAWLAPRLLLPGLAVAALVLLAVAVTRPTRAPAPAVAVAEPGLRGGAASGRHWAVTSLTGTPVVGARPVAARDRLAVGETLATDARSSARITFDEVGEVVVDPGSRLRLVAAADGAHRLALDRGALQAFIVAPPGQFVVETRSATAVDLGCVYTLRAGESGDGILSVQAGWVGFEFDGRESFVPAGASCRTSAARGPGLPHFDDAPRRFKEAVEQLETEEEGPARTASLGVALSTARPRDAVTLWHLLSRVTAAERPQVVAALGARVPLPDGVTESQVLRLDQAALDRWWNALGLGDIGMWRTWKRPMASTR